ncbi:hypothetical protein D3C86_1762750 [compost metagenome]
MLQSEHLEGEEAQRVHGRQKQHLMQRLAPVAQLDPAAGHWNRHDNKRAGKPEGQCIERAGELQCHFGKKK